MTNMRIRYVAREIGTTFLSLLVLLLASGNPDWIRAWLYFLVTFSYQVISMIILNRKNPEILEKRATVIQKGTKGFDRWFVALFLIFAYSILIVSGLDVRLGISTVPFLFSIIAGCIFVFACIIGSWAMVENAHFHMTVVIEGKDQGVCDTGPYKHMRHPGYAAEILAIVCSPVVLGTWLAYIPSGLLITLFVIRTYLEDSSLRSELEGYMKYSERTRFRLIPKIW